MAAGEEAVLQSLRERGLLDGQVPDPRDAEIKRLRKFLVRISGWQDRVAKSTTMTRMAMREGAADTRDEILKFLYT